MALPQLTKAQSLEYQHEYEQGWSLLKKVMASRMRQDARNSSTASDAQSAIQHFALCLKLLPDAWPCIWGTGKAFQMLGKHTLALEWFERALQIESKNPDVWREATAEALATGDADKAVQYASAAIGLQPKDAGLRANFALALLLAGRDAEAHDAARTACSLDRTDELNRRVLQLIEAVMKGDCERPQSMERMERVSFHKLPRS